MNRRDFFRRTGASVGAVALVATPLSLLGQDAPPASLHIDGATLHGGGLKIHGNNFDGVSITNCTFTGISDRLALEIVNNAR